MNPGGRGQRARRRTSRENRMLYDRLLSERHLDYWGDDCPAVDLDFLMCEYNHGVSVAIVDYKWHGADFANTNSATFQTLSELYGPDHKQLPFFIARYWTENWAFKLLAVNEAAKSAVRRISSGTHDVDEQIDLTEKQYVSFLYRLRKDALSAGDRRYLERLNDQLPPVESGATQGDAA